VPFGEGLDAGAIPSCSDEGGVGCRGAKAARVEVFRLHGIDPAISIGVLEGGARVYYVAPGYFPELSDHPLHDAIFEGRSDRPDERAGWRCGSPLDLSGTAVRTPGWGTIFAVRFAGDQVRRQYGYTAVFVDARSRIAGFDRKGIPYIEAGDKLRASVRECTASGERYKVVADLIQPGAT
jgi:hypothetical protein